AVISGPKPYIDVTAPFVIVGGVTYTLGADPTGVADSTTAINNAMLAANLAGAWVLCPGGTYKVTTLLYYNNTYLKGAGAGIGSGAAGAVTTISQAAGTAAPLIRPNSIASTQGGLIMEDILFSAFSNQASNAGGVLVQAFNLSKLTRVQVDYTAAFGFKQIGGSTLGDTAFNTYFQCMVS